MKLELAFEEIQNDFADFSAKYLALCSMQLEPDERCTIDDFTYLSSQLGLFMGLSHDILRILSKFDEYSEKFLISDDAKLIQPKTEYVKE